MTEAGIEDGGRVSKPRYASSHYKLKKVRKQVLPSEPPERTSTAKTLTLA